MYPTGEHAYAGSLCEHALDCHYELSMLCNAYAPGKYTEEDIIKVALFKDIYRAILYEPYTRKQIVDGTWQDVMAFRQLEERPVYGDMGFSSYMIAKNFVSFTDEQIEAICHHNLGMENGFKSRDIYGVMQTYPLVVLTCMADFAALYLQGLAPNT